MDMLKKRLMNENKSLTYEPYVTSYEEYIIEKNTERSIGRKEGMEKGIEVGVEQGIEKGTLEIAKNMIKDNAPLDLIVKYTDLPLNKIKKLMNRID